MNVTKFKYLLVLLLPAYSYSFENLARSGDIESAYQSVFLEIYQKTGEILGHVVHANENRYFALPDVNTTLKAQLFAEF